MAKERELQENEDRMEATMSFDDLRFKLEENVADSEMHARPHTFSKVVTHGATLEVEHCVPEAILVIILDATFSLRNIL